MGAGGDRLVEILRTGSCTGQQQTRQLHLSEGHRQHLDADETFIA